jgi:hypothetical protein
MRPMTFRILGAFLVTALLTGGATAMAADQSTREQPKAGAPDKDAQSVCDMMSPNGAHAMQNMMEMARRMGNGDPMLGMTRMMEMMGSMGGGMSGGPGGTMQPGGPGK